MSEKKKCNKCKVDPKNLWRLKEFAKETGVSIQTARYRMQQEIGCKKVKINGGYLVYFEKD